MRRAGRLLAALALVVAALATLPMLAWVSPHKVTGAVRALARALLRAIGVTHRMHGTVPTGPTLVVANHVSWLDAVVLLAHLPARLLAKHQVRRWPVIGVLATAAGSVYIDRSRPRTLPATVAAVATALRSGAIVAVFPEGTTFCGRDLGGLRPAMFQAAIDAGARVVPLRLSFHLADGRSTTVAAFIGSDTLISSIRRIVAAEGLHVVAEAFPELEPASCRRAMARSAEVFIAASKDAAPHRSPVRRPVHSGASLRY